MEVAEQNRSLRAGDEQNNENQEEEAKHVVHLMRPETLKATHGKILLSSSEVQRLKTGVSG